ncbi:hypothetical protein H2199_008803 [Coniosporium tulheliwenetii]|uniref:Uncharacterized protein n=1 Tax=Coniosporium tulheliwenetii TaxID=3383036 RepID=A0ACC2YII2_9PEZI|nr:hypothetical protein H2199_008803 [Cladosporium sp. JES 115]
MEGGHLLPTLLCKWSAPAILPGLRRRGKPWSKRRRTTNTGKRRAIPKGEQQPSSVRDQVERQLAQKLRKAELSRVGADQTAAAKYPLHLSPWLEMTRWPGYLHGCDLEKTAQLIELPLHISDHLDLPLLELLSSFDRVIEEARNSIAHEKVNVFDQHRVNSFIRQHAAYKPILTKLQEGTYKRYKDVWKRLICFVYRVAYKRQGPLLHYLLTDTQSLALGDVLDAARMALARKGDADPVSQQAAPAYRPGLAPEECKARSKDDSLAELKALQERLDDSCLRFCISLLDHSLKGNIYDSVIVGFFAVLGINVSTGGFHEAAGYTSHLSAFIKMAQMLVMQRAVRASDLGEVDFPAELLDEMQDRFMVYGSRSPMNWAQKLRTYGAKVRDNTTSLGFIIWSDDGQHLSYKDFELDMQQLRWFVRDQVDLAQAQLEELLLVHPEEVREDVVPAINMHGIKDNPSVSEAGWSFLSDGRNQEQFGNHDRWLLNRVLDNKWLQEEFLPKPKVAKWSKRAAERYMQQVDAFLERLLLLIHLTDQAAGISSLLFLPGLLYIAKLLVHAMARKDSFKLKYPRKAHPTFTAEEAKERERQKQREKRARRRSERAQEAAQEAASEPQSNELWPEKTLVEPESEDEDEQEPDVSEYEEDPAKTAKERCQGRTISKENERSAAAWIEEHMLEETVCERCLAGEGHGNADDLSLEEMAEFFRSSGLPDSMRESKRTPLPLTSKDLLWKKVLTGGDCPRRINIGKSHQVDPDLSVTFDIDAFVAEAASFEALRGFRFSYYPKAVQNLDKPIHIWFHGRQLHQCRHIRFGEALHAQSFWIYIGFPRMPRTRETYLTEVQHALWIDEVVLPSLREVLPPTSMQHLPPSWAHGASKMKAKHNEHKTRDVGGTDPIHYPVKEQYMPGLWERMREKLSKSCLAEFRGMFMVIQAYGTKLVWNDSNFSRLRDDFKTSLNSIVNIDYLILPKTFVDIGKECISLHSSRIHWWKRCCLRQWVASMNPENHVATRSYPVSGLRDAAATNLRVSQRHPMHSQGLVYAQRYGSYKEAFDARKVFPFSNKNIESLLIPMNLLQLWSRAGGTIGRSNHINDFVVAAGQRSYLNSKKRVNLSLEVSCDEKFGTREEYRVSWGLLHELDLDSRECRRAEPRPYVSIPTVETLAFLRWELNRWLGAFDHIRQKNPQLTPETGAMGTMLARFKSEIQSAFRFFIPDSKRTYKERRSQVSNATKLYNGINDIAKFLGKGRRREHQLERIRRICFLALTMQMLQFDVKNQPLQPPKDLESYNSGICYAWLRRYYSNDFTIPKPWRVCTTWKRSPTWADLLQQLFDWDDQDRYKIPFQRDRWNNLQFRLITRHAFMRINEQLGLDAAEEWKNTLGMHASRFFWMIPKCSGNRFVTMTKKTYKADGEKMRGNHMAWYSAIHSELESFEEHAHPRKWSWKNQKLWDWERGEIMKRPPLRLFDDLESFDFSNT